MVDDVKSGYMEIEIAERMQLVVQHGACIWCSCPEIAFEVVIRPTPWMLWNEPMRRVKKERRMANLIEAKSLDWLGGQRKSSLDIHCWFRLDHDRRIRHLTVALGDLREPSHPTRRCLGHLVLMYP